MTEVVIEVGPKLHSCRNANDYSSGIREIVQHFLEESNRVLNVLDHIEHGQSVDGGTGLGGNITRINAQQDVFLGQYRGCWLSQVNPPYVPAGTSKVIGDDAGAAADLQHSGA